MLCSIKLEKLFGNFWFALLLVVRRAQYVWRVFGSVRHSPGLDVLWRHHLGISSDRERLLCAWLCFRFLSSLGSEKIRVDWSKLAYTRFLSLSQQNSLSTRPRATLSRPFFRCSGKLRIWQVWKIFRHLNEENDIEVDKFSVQECDYLLPVVGREYLARKYRSQTTWS